MSLSVSNEVSRIANSSIGNAIAAFQAGQPVLIHDFDDREGEVDLVYPARAADSSAVTQLRNDAGGLICVALSDGAAQSFGLPFIQDIIDHPAAASTQLEYDERSSFSITVNHRETRTGITDDDRAKTIATLGKAAAAPDHIDFASEFRAPGHVHLLRAAPGLLDDRQGHTELGIALSAAAGVPPAVVVCEMLDDNTGRALSKSKARKYAERQEIPYISGQDILEELK